MYFVTTWTTRAYYFALGCMSQLKIIPHTRCIKLLVYQRLLYLRQGGEGRTVGVEILKSLDVGVSDGVTVGVMLAVGVGVNLKKFILAISKPFLVV